MSVMDTVETTAAEPAARHVFTDEEQQRGARASADRRRAIAQREAEHRRAWWRRERELHEAYMESRGREAHDARHAWRTHLAAGPGGC